MEDKEIPEKNNNNKNNDINLKENLKQIKEIITKIKTDIEKHKLTKDKDVVVRLRAKYTLKDICLIEKEIDNISTSPESLIPYKIFKLLIKFPSIIDTGYKEYSNIQELSKSIELINKLLKVGK